MANWVFKCPDKCKSRITILDILSEMSGMVIFAKTQINADWLRGFTQIRYYGFLGKTQIRVKHEYI